MTYLAIDQVLSDTWPTIQLRRVARIRREANKFSNETLLSLSAHVGVRPRPEGGGNQLPSEETITGYWIAHPGDLVFNPMWAIEGGVAVSDIRGALSTAYRVYEFSDEVYPRFAHYFFRSQPAIEQYRMMVRGLTTFDRSVGREDFEAMPLPLPLITEQRAIADYLDAETARIDALIEKKERMTDLLEEREIVLAHEMLSGAWVSCSQRQEVHSWLAPVPQDWPVAPVGSQFRVVLGRMLNAERASGDDLKPYIRNINVRWDVVNVNDLAVMEFPPSERAKYALRDGDLLINEGGAGIGRAAIWHDELRECYFQKSVLRLRPIGWTRAEWMVECMRVAVAQEVLLVEGNLATIPHVPAEALRPMRFPFPPADVQDLLLHRLYAERSRDRKLHHQLTAQISLLRERRQALITAAVTGELDIEGAAA